MRSRGDRKQKRQGRPTANTVPAIGSEKRGEKQAIKTIKRLVTGVRGVWDTKRSRKKKRNRGQTREEAGWAQ